MKIYSPVLNFNGIRCNVRFVKGVGESDDPKVIEWFKNRGYEIEETQKVDEAATVQLENTSKSVEDVGIAIPLEVKDMNPNELRDWMRANGYGRQIKNIRNNEKLLDIIRRGRSG